MNNLVPPVRRDRQGVRSVQRAVTQRERFKSQESASEARP
jgi:hypothetical protein